MTCGNSGNELHLAAGDDIGADVVAEGAWGRREGSTCFCTVGYSKFTYC